MPKNKVRGKAFSMILYPDSDNHMKALKAIESCYSYAYILHMNDVDDDDNLKKAHIHCIVKFNTQKLLSSFAQEVGLEENYIQKVQSLQSSVRYLVHKDNPEKFQYDPELICSNWNYIELDKYINGQMTVEEKALRVIEMMETADSLQELISLCIQTHCYDELRRMGNLAINLFHEMKGQKRHD